MPNKIKILQSVNSLGMGGTVIFVMNFYRHIDKEKFQVDFVIYDDSRMDFYEEVTENGSIVYVCHKKYKNKYLNLLYQMHQVRRLLKEHHYDVIHTHGNSFIELFRGVIPGWMMRNTKVIAHSHNPGEPQDTYIDKVFRYLCKVFLSRIVDMGCTCSDVAAEGKYTKTFMHLSRYCVINNAINTNNYLYDTKKRFDIRKKLGIAENQFVLGHVGRISYQKNHDFLIDIFQEYFNRNPEARLLLVGDGEDRLTLEDKINEKKLSPFVIFTGQCVSAAEYYQAMDCFVLPSHYEGFPFVLVEAQINGLRCIVSDVITRSVNISGGVVFVSLQNNSAVWAHEIELFGTRRMSNQEVSVVAEQYEISKETKKLENLYIKLFNGM